MLEPENKVPARWWESPPPNNLDIALDILSQRKEVFHRNPKENKAYLKLFDWVDQKLQEKHREVKEAFPIAFFKPSYEQSLLLNAWIWGYTFPIVFAANRIGKTAASIINALLWILPNDPEWEIFTPYTDHLGRKVHVLPRPYLHDISKYQVKLRDSPPLRTLLENHNAELTQQESPNLEIFATLQNDNTLPPPAFPDPPIITSETLWFGAPDADFHKNVVRPELKRWLPKSFITQDSQVDLSMEVSVSSPSRSTPIKHSILFKSYESKDTKWSGAAVAGITLTEGVPIQVLSEIKQRFKADSFGWWDYTPYEARNTGAKTVLAYKVYQGKEQLPRFPKVFTKFSVRNSPDYIISEEKRRDMLKAWEGKAEGKARIDGEFYASSGLLLEKLDRNFHILDWTKEELFERYPNAQLFRGFDPGYDHPTSCVWAALLPQNIWVVYRCWSARGKTIDERCDMIIKLSGNKRVAKQAYSQNGVISKDHIYKEVHAYPDSEAYIATIGDYHLFQVDQVTGQSNVINYFKSGLNVIESVHTSPRDRVLQLDKLLDRNDFVASPLTKRPPGARVYFLIKEYGVAEMLDKFEELFWERLSAGPYKGEAKDSVPTHGDDELDALCYLTSSPFVHTNIVARKISDVSEIEFEDLTLHYERVNIK